MAFSDDTVFTACGGPPALIKRWDSDVVVFHPLAAETHLLDPPTAALLDMLGARPLSLEELRGDFVGAFREQFTDGDAEAYLGQALEQLCAIDLIRVLENASA
jgi:PqqD family protein of HPr-rel-A system